MSDITYLILQGNRQPVQDPGNPPPLPQGPWGYPQQTAPPYSLNYPSYANGGVDNNHTVR